MSADQDRGETPAKVEVTPLDRDTCSQVKQEGGMPSDSTAGSRHRHIWLRSGAKCEVCRGPRYFVLL